MFGKIRDKLKSVFEKSEEIIEEKEEQKIDENINNENFQKEFEKKGELEEREEIQEKSSKRFFKNIFKKKGNKEEKDLEELEELQDEMLEETPIEEKNAIKEKKDLSKKDIENNKKKLEYNIKKEELVEIDEIEEIENIQVEKLEENKEKEEKKSLFSKTLDKLKSKKITNEDFDKIWIELEIFLLEINIAYEIVEKIEIKLKEALIDNSFNRFKLSEKIREVLIEEVEIVLSSREADFLDQIIQLNKKGEIAKILILGVNGTGKTTTIAKIVNFLQKNNLSVVVAASDTFRAAAIEQLEEHSKKLNFKLIKHVGGSDPAAVAFDAIDHAKAKKLNVVLIDTAGRMPNNSNLMFELQKIKRVVNSQLTIFIGDSISGNDLIEQINLFDKGINIDGVILTKIDTDERPGSVVTTAYSIEKPIYFLGIGQNYEDLVKFNAKDIAIKLFNPDEE